MKLRSLALKTGGVVFLGSVLVVPFQSLAAAAMTNYVYPTSEDIIITEVQTASAASGGEEFVELYNNTDADIDLADAAHSGKDAWKLQYFSGSKVAGLLGMTDWASPTRTIALTGVVPAHEYYVLAGGSYQPGNIVPDQGYTATLSDDAGALQLVDSTVAGTVTTMTIHDRLAWSTDKTLSNAVLYAAPGAASSLQHLPNADTEYVNEDTTLTGFTGDSRISPANAWTAPVVEEEPPEEENAAVPVSDTTEEVAPPVQTVPANQGLPVPLVTELLPNPASPQTDEVNEYIELYNPGDIAFNLKGYSLETGTTTLHDFTFTEDTLVEAHAFRAFFSSDTGLSLSNSGGQARLVDPNGAVLGQSAAYGTAPDGQAWVVDETDGTWHWTTVPTPNASNIIRTPIVLAKATVVKTSKKKAAAKVKGASTVKKAKKAKVAKAKVAKKTTGTALAANTGGPGPAPVHVGILAAVAALAVGYGVYEYRHDLGNRFHQFRTNRTARRSARK